MSEPRPTHQGGWDQQQREDGCDDAGRDVLLGEVDGVEVDAELREAEKAGREQAPLPRRRLSPFPAASAAMTTAAMAKR